MIELNLLEKKQPLRLPIVLGMDLNTINLKMLGVALFIYYVPGMILDSTLADKMAEVETQLNEVQSKNIQLKNEINKDTNIKEQLEAYRVQESKLKSRSAQVDEILRNRTNPKKVLEKIARSIPEDLWFNELVINEKNEVTISGGSYTSRAIGEFISVVNDSPYFGGSITPAKQENKQENLDGVITGYDLFELKGKIINYDMRTN
jgi:Tfp pilus assembly protein PilN